MKGAITVMENQSVKRIRRTPEQRAEEINVKIQKMNQELDDLKVKRDAVIQEFDKKEEAIKARIKEQEKKKEALLAPKPPRKPRKTKKQKIQDIIKLANKSGLKPEEIAQRLGLDQAEE